MTEPFNPLAMSSLASSMITKILEAEPTLLDNVPRFTGAGIYAIYYVGDFPAYSALVLGDSSENVGPIYVGKAVPSGGRRGVEVSSGAGSTVLCTRIRQHAVSLRTVENLRIDDFLVRWLVVDDIWIPLGESALIRRYKPLWNALIDGFGNHDPGSGRLQGIRSRWDTLHPGRPFAAKYPPRTETASEISQEAKEYLRSRLA